MSCLISVEPDTCLNVGAKCTLMDIKKVLKEAGRPTECASHARA